MRKLYSKKVLKRKKNLYRIICLIIISFLCFKGVGANAGVNDAKLEKNRTDGYYAVASFNGEVHLYYLDIYTLNGVVSYCIDLGTSITTDIYNSTEDFGVSKLSSSDKEYVQAISYFGYKYPGHNSIYYYMASQELIWEYLSGGEVEWTNVLDKNGDRIDIEDYKNEVRGLATKYLEEVKLNFINGKNYEIDNLLVIGSFSGDLSSYEIADNGYTTNWIENGFLKLKIGGEYVGRNVVTLKKKGIYTEKSKLYYYDNSQRLISVGNFIDDTIEISMNIVGRDIDFQIIDGETKESIPSGQGSFKGAIYNLYDSNGNFIEEFETDESGRGRIENLPYGHYMVKQVKESMGYVINLGEIWFDFGSEEMPFKLEECPIYQNVEIYKVYDKNGMGEFINEGDVLFSILDSNGNRYGSVTTNDEGIANIRLPYGEYIFHQENSIRGYNKVDDFIVKIDSNGEIKRINLVDGLIKNNIKINIRDKSLKTLISDDGFKYKIYDKVNKKYIEDNGSDIFSSNGNGEVIIPDLGYGDYRIEEIEVPNGFVHTGQVVEVSLNENTDFSLVDGVFIYTLDIYEKLLNGSVKVLTTKEVFSYSDNEYHYDKEVRGKVKIDVVTKKDINIYGNVIYKANSVIMTLSTNEKGVLEFSTYLGDYCLVDKETNEEKCFTLKDEEHGKEKISKSLEFVEVISKNNIQYSNKDKQGDAIKGTVVLVKDKSDNLLYTGITDDEGIFQVKDLPNGEYCFYQKKVPSNYIINEKNICISVDSSKLLWEVDVSNDRVKRIIEVPNTLEHIGNIKKLGVMLGIFMGGIFYKKKYGKKMSDR